MATLAVARVSTSVVTASSHCSVPRRKLHASYSAASSPALRGQALRTKAPAKTPQNVARGVVAAVGPFGDLSSVTPLLPRLLPAIARAGMLFVGFWASMNWVFYRKLRRQGEKYVDLAKTKEEARQEKLKKLAPQEKKEH